VKFTAESAFINAETRGLTQRKLRCRININMNTSKNKLLEWSGVITAIIYSILVALNIGAEFVGFSLLLTSAILIGLWAYYGKHGGILLLQLFYASAGIIGMVRWF